MILKRLLQVSAFIAILAVLLFVPAGRVDWVMGWAFIGVYVVGVLLTAAYVGRINPDLIEERTQVKEGTKGWDRVLTNLFSLVALPGVMIVAGLDMRFGWSSFPMPVQLMALAFNGLGYGLVVWAMATNAFFATYVRIQTDRGHKVVTDGPYRFVRHPGYVGMVTLLSTPPTAVTLSCSVDNWESSYMSRRVNRKKGKEINYWRQGSFALPPSTPAGPAGLVSGRKRSRPS